jgi:APA family basic amino acid/polyamine antiporter
MARDGRFFAPFARLSPTFGTPIAAILLLGLTAIALLVAAGAEAVDRLTTGAVFIDGIFFSLTGLALIILRRRTGPPDGFRVPLYPIVPLAFVLGEFGLLAGALMNKETLAASIIGVGWIIGAALIYAFFFRRPANHPDVTP